MENGEEERVGKRGNNLNGREKAKGDGSKNGKKKPRIKVDALNVSVKSLYHYTSERRELRSRSCFCEYVGPVLSQSDLFGSVIIKNSFILFERHSENQWGK